MLFWIKNLSALALVVGASAALLYHYHGVVESRADQGLPVSDKFSGLSQYYQKYRFSHNQYADTDAKKYILDNPLPDVTLTDYLRSQDLGKRTVSGAWVGPVQNHRFVEGDHLKIRMQEIAASHNMKLVWWLKKDYIVKESFRINNTSVGALYEIATAIDGDFQREVKTFFCPMHRSLVITDKVEHYLRDHCAQGRNYQKILN
ncbi:TcpQ domain-containing protein [Gayadomonas joobiniege]|uniref:TcpQ domain-containing protein n=1 Tax=Gayadomonas joobiniege TaxID=1234606 RepID=UPI00036DE128|nr:TcpQ domain-containing protein [Gayadomonas joobiniege]